MSQSPGYSFCLWICPRSLKSMQASAPPSGKTHILILLRLFSEELGKKKWKMNNSNNSPAAIWYPASCNDQQNFSPGCAQVRGVNFSLATVHCAIMSSNISAAINFFCFLKRSTGHLTHSNELQKSTSVSDGWVLVFWPFHRNCL